MLFILNSGKYVKNQLLLSPHPHPQPTVQIFDCWWRGLKNDSKLFGLHGWPNENIFHSTKYDFAMQCNEFNLYFKTPLKINGGGGGVMHPIPGDLLYSHVLLP